MLYRINNLITHYMDEYLSIEHEILQSSDEPLSFTEPINKILFGLDDVIEGLTEIKRMLEEDKRG